MADNNNTDVTQSEGWGESHSEGGAVSHTETTADGKTRTITRGWSRSRGVTTSKPKSGPGQSNVPDEPRIIEP